MPRHDPPPGGAGPGMGGLPVGQGRGGREGVGLAVGGGRQAGSAYDEERMARSLGEAGLVPEVIEVEREVQRFETVEQGLAAAVGLADRWKADGRWHRYLAFLEEGGRTLTRSHLLVKARKP